MITLRYWFRPAFYLFAWMLAVALTLAELSTVAPALASIGAEPLVLREGKGGPLRARTQHVQHAARRTLAP